jgi:cell division protein FtsQ
LFRLKTAEEIEILQARHVSPEAVRERFAVDVGRSLFWVPLGKRRRAVEEIPWVESAAVERILPDKLRVFLIERTPVAFLRQGNFLWLIDAEGVLLPVPEGGDYNFPVVAGIPDSFSREQRAVRVKLYLDLLEEVDAGGKAHSAQISEVDVSDMEDVSVVVADPVGTVRVHFGRGRYGEKFESFLEHRPLWQKRGEEVQSVDLRYRGQIVLNPDRSKVARR